MTHLKRINLSYFSIKSRVLWGFKYFLVELYGDLNIFSLSNVISYIIIIIITLLQKQELTLLNLHRLLKRRCSKFRGGIFEIYTNFLTC